MSVQNSDKSKKEFPRFKAGDTVRVHLKVVEGDSERIQAFEGVCIRRRGQGVSESFTVRKISFGVGVERILPLHSPRIQKLELVKTGKARRAKLYYLRELSGKAARLKEEDSVDAAVEARSMPQASDSAAPSNGKDAAQDTPKAEAAAA